MSPASPFPPSLQPPPSGDRQSTRAYLPTPVPDDLVAELAREARRAPSGANLQPGLLIAVQGEPRQRLTAALRTAWQAGAAEPEDYDYFPKPMPMHLRKRQVAAAQALYGSLGIGRDDRERRDAQFGRNFEFFGAPVALLVAIDRSFGAGGYLDLGMFLYGYMLAAEARGLATCAIGALASYPNLIRRELGLAPELAIVCGLALGHRDPDAPVNRTTTARCALDEYFRRIG